MVIFNAFFILLIGNFILFSLMYFVFIYFGLTKKPSWMNSMLPVVTSDEYHIPVIAESKYDEYVIRYLSNTLVDKVETGSITFSKYEVSNAKLEIGFNVPTKLKSQVKNNNAGANLFMFVPSDDERLVA